MQSCIGVHKKMCIQIFNSSSPVLTEFINIKTSIKEIILQLLLIMVFFIVIKIYLAARDCEKNIYMMQCLIQIKSLKIVQVSTLDSTLIFGYLVIFGYIHESVNVEENIFSF